MLHFRFFPAIALLPQLNQRKFNEAENRSQAPLGLQRIPADPCAFKQIDGAKPELFTRLRLRMNPSKINDSIRRCAMNQIHAIDFDSAKYAIRIYAVNQFSGDTMILRFGRKEVLRFPENMPPCTVGFQAFGDSYHFTCRLMRTEREDGMTSFHQTRPKVMTSKN